jgi:hypothetical protein
MGGAANEQALGASTTPRHGLRRRHWGGMGDGGGPLPPGSAGGCPPLLRSAGGGPPPPRSAGRCPPPPWSVGCGPPGASSPWQEEDNVYGGCEGLRTMATTGGWGRWRRRLEDDGEPVVGVFFDFWNFYFFHDFSFSLAVARAAYLVLSFISKHNPFHIKIQILSQFLLAYFSNG